MDKAEEGAMGMKGFGRGLRDIVVSLFWMILSILLAILVAAPVIYGLDQLFAATGFSVARPDMASFLSIILGLAVGVAVLFWLDRRLRRWLGYSPLEAWDFLRWIP